MGWNVLDLPGARIETVDLAPVFQLGLKCCARNTTTGFAGEFVYAKGVASVVAGSWCLINHDSGEVTLLADGDVGPAGVAMGATIEDTYGWFQVKGKASAYLGANCADNAILYTTSTAGMADDTATSQSEIMGSRCAALVGGASANGEVELDYPVLTSVGG